MKTNDICTVLEADPNALFEVRVGKGRIICRIVPGTTDARMVTVAQGNDRRTLPFRSVLRTVNKTASNVREAYGLDTNDLLEYTDQFCDTERALLKEIDAEDPAHFAETVEEWFPIYRPTTDTKGGERNPLSIKSQ